MRHSGHLRKLLLVGAAACLFFGAAFSNSTVIRKIDGAYSAIIVQELDFRKTTYIIQRECQFIQACLIDVLLASNTIDPSKQKQSVFNNFKEMDKQLASLGRSAVTVETRQLVLRVADSLLIYRRACSTYFVLLDENKISDASMFLRFNVHRSFTSATEVLSAIPELLDRNLQTQSERMSNDNSVIAGIIQNAGVLPVILWLCAATLLFIVYRGMPFPRVGLSNRRN